MSPRNSEPVEVVESDVAPTEAKVEEAKVEEAKVETVKLAVDTPLLDEFVAFVGEGDESTRYVVTPAGIDVPAEVADTLVEQALSVSVLLTVKG